MQKHKLNIKLLPVVFLLLAMLPFLTGWYLLTSFEKHLPPNPQFSESTSHLAPVPATDKRAELRETFRSTQYSVTWLLLIGPILGGVLAWLWMKQSHRLLAPLMQHIRELSHEGKSLEPLKEFPEGRFASLTQDFNRLITRISAQEDGFQQQLHFLQTLLDAIPAPIFYKDEAGRYLGCNQAFEKIIGVKREEILGKTPFDLAPTAHATIYRTMDDNLLQKGPGHSQVYESKLKTADGTQADVIFYKANFTNRDGTLGGLIGTILDISDRKAMEAEVNQTLSLLEATLDASMDGILVTDLRGAIQIWNTRLRELLRLEPGLEIAELDCEAILNHIQDGLKDRSRLLRSLLVEQGPSAREGCETLFFQDGRILELGLRPQLRNGTWIGYVLSFRDIAEQRTLEQQLLQAQKMEAIGQLAGGVAHDFNNLLTVINGFSAILVRSLHDQERPRREAEQILRAGERAANLTRQLLAFSRRQVLSPKVIDLNRLILGFQPMLRRVIPECIAIRLELAEELRPVKADPGQMEQVLMNLVVNARDAIPGDGRIIIRSSSAVISSGQEEENPTPQACIRLTVEDSGQGISREVKERIFEPFFTTKEANRGTGLGLATVYGIVRQSKGHIEVESEVGVGTRMHIYLPVTEGPLSVAENPAEFCVFPKGQVLVVEDQKDVLDLVSSALGSYGFKVLEASCGADAERLFAQHETEIEMLLTDVVMPGISGPQLARNLKKIKPDLKVLFMSGYNDLPNDEAETGVDLSSLLSKPFTPDELVHRVTTFLAEDGSRQDCHAKQPPADR